jgi:CBS domain-containing protein
MHVRDLMTQQVVTLMRNDKLSLADDLMSLARVRHLPVLDEDARLVGVLTQRDLFRSALAQALGYGAAARRRLLKTIAVKEIMTPDPVTVEPDATIEQAAQLMLEKKIGCLPVVERGVLAGIVTEGDFVKLAAEGPRRLVARSASAG